MQKLVLLSEAEHQLRITKIREAFLSEDASYGIIIADNANMFYVTGRVFAGYVYIPSSGQPTYFVRRPVELNGDNVIYIRKPEDMGEAVARKYGPIARIGLELDSMPFSTVERLSRIFPDAQLRNASEALRNARAVKTDVELRMLADCGVKQERVYRRIPHMYQEGMTDLELQVEIERISRLEGCLGQFRISGSSMELYMGSILTGDNADSPSPYDFAMGGAGIDPSLPVGANGSEIKPGNTVMVDMNGNFNGYMTDMTRVFSLGRISEFAQKAHQCSINIHNTLRSMARPGMEAKALYEEAMRIVREEQLENYFMGHRQHAGFIGHGVGIEINELPVIAPRSRDILQADNVIALEPKFVIPHVGAVGIENTYVVTADGLKCLTNAPEEIIGLE